MACSLIIIAHNIRSTHNVGALMRTCEGLGVNKLFLTGYTPYPASKTDKRLPHIAEKLSKQIHKTALGAEDSLHWIYRENINAVLSELREDGYVLAGLEQTATSRNLPDFNPPAKLALLLGSEVAGIDPGLIDILDYCLEIPMRGKKESFNVVEATSMALYHCLADSTVKKIM